MFKRLKNTENTQKNLINDNDDDESIYQIPQWQFDSEHDQDRDQEKQKINIGSKPQIVFDYLKGLSQEAEDLMIELEDAEDDLDKEKLMFVGSNGEKFNFNPFKILPDFLSNTYHGKITFKKSRNASRKFE